MACWLVDQDDTSFLLIPGQFFCFQSWNLFRCVFNQRQTAFHASAIRGLRSLGKRRQGDNPLCAQTNSSGGQFLCAWCWTAKQENEASFCVSWQMFYLAPKSHQKCPCGRCFARRDKTIPNVGFPLLWTFLHHLESPFCSGAQIVGQIGLHGQKVGKSSSAVSNGAHHYLYFCTLNQRSSRFTKLALLSLNHVQQLVNDTSCSGNKRNIDHN